MYPQLRNFTHVFLRVDKVAPSLSQPYTGPHEVLSKSNKHITVSLNGKKSCVSLDRVKLAMIFNDMNSQPADFRSSNSLTPTDHSYASNNRQTKSGKHVRFPKRLITVIM